MLSEKEYNKILEQLNETTSTISTNTRKNLRKQLKEHKYSTKYAPFEPLPHITNFINRTTTEKTLLQLIQAATMSSEFIIDTESFNVFRQTNKPALIQLQILSPHNSSFVLLVEAHHLPKSNHICFQLIQQLFRIILVPEKTIYIFGLKQELDPFAEFKLFCQDQIDNAHILNLQEKFKTYWNQQHPHQRDRATSSTTFTNCICEKCIGKKSSEIWSLQDCVAYLLNEHLPKTHSNDNFQIGLDPTLFGLNTNEQQHRSLLSTYAKNDCLSMERLIIRMKNDQFEFESNPITQTLNNIFNPSREHEPFNNPYAQVKQKHSKFKLPILDDELEFISSDDDYPTEQQLSNRNLSKKLLTPSINILETNNELLLTQDVTMTHTPERLVPLADHEHRYPSDRESTLTNDNRPDEYDTTEQSSSNRPESKLSAEERKRIHNQSCTRRQRRRYFRNEIICRNIDRRFTYAQIKTILRQNNVEFSAVNTSRSSTSNKISLYIGIKQTDKTDEYEQITQDLFTTGHYRSWYRNRQPTSSSNHRRLHHRTSLDHRRRHHQTSSNHQQTSNDRQRYQHRN